MINIFLTQLVFNLELIIDIFALVSYFLLSFVFNPYPSPVSLICINLHTVTHSKYARSSLPCMKSLLDTCVPSRIGLGVAFSCPMEVSLQGHLRLFWFLSWVWSLISCFPSLLLCSSIFLEGPPPQFSRVMLDSFLVMRPGQGTLIVLFGSGGLRAGDTVQTGDQNEVPILESW